MTIFPGRMGEVLQAKLVEINNFIIQKVLFSFFDMCYILFSWVLGGVLSFFFVLAFVYFFCFVFSSSIDSSGGALVLRSAFPIPP